MPDGFEIAQRGMRGGFPRGGFPRGGFPMRRFPHRFPIRRFPRFFFFPVGFPHDRCEFIDRWGRCCDRWGRCFGDWDMGPWTGSDDMSDSWFGTPVAWDRIDDRELGEDPYDQY